MGEIIKLRNAVQDEGDFARVSNPNAAISNINDSFDSALPESSFEVEESALEETDPAVSTSVIHLSL